MGDIDIVGESRPQATIRATKHLISILKTFRRHRDTLDEALAKVLLFAVPDRDAVGAMNGQESLEKLLRIKVITKDKKKVVEAV